MNPVSRQIQPLISTEALSGLQVVVPGRRADGAATTESSHALVSRSSSQSRVRQVLLTSLPLVVADLAAIALCYLAAAVLTTALSGRVIGPGVFRNLAALCSGYAVIGTFAGIYPATGVNPVRELRDQICSLFAAFVLLITLNQFVGVITPYEVVTAVLALAAALVVAPVARFGMRRLCGHVSWWGEKVIIVGAGKQGQSVCEFFRRMPQRGLRPLGLVDDDPARYWSETAAEFSAGSSSPVASPPPGAAHASPFLGTTDELLDLCRTKDCHWVIAAVSDRDPDDVVRISDLCSCLPNTILLHSSLMLPSLWSETFDAAGLSGIHVRDRLQFPLQRAFKRLFDVTLAATLLLAASPLLLAAAAVIRWKSPGPVLFRHHGRIGRNGTPFGALKIRTMMMNAAEVLEKHLASSPAARQEWERDLKLKEDPRIIPGIGTFLRRTSLDELPQLWNVLTGDMSLVGPRPIYTDIEVAKFAEAFPLYTRMRPGLTGLWQVSGRNNTSYQDRVRLDTYYVRNWSPWLDYFLLLRTVRTVLLREGSY